MIKPMRKYRVTGHIREIKSDEITRGKKCKTGLNFIKCQIWVDNNKVIKKSQLHHLLKSKVFELLTI